MGLLENVPLICEQWENKISRRVVLSLGTFRQDFFNEGTGGALWDSSSLLLQDDIVCLLKNQCVLELGSGGVGLIALSAVLAGAGPYYATDGDEHVVELLKENLKRNGQKDSLQVFQWKWGNDNDRDRLAPMLPNVQYVLASDILHLIEVYDALLQTLEVIRKASPSVHFILSFRVRHAEQEEMFLEKLQNNGWKLKNFYQPKPSNGLVRFHFQASSQKRKYHE